MPRVEFSQVCRLLTVDGNFSKEEAEYVTRFAKEGLVARQDLFDSFKEMEKATVPAKPGMSVMADYFESTAQGVERFFHLADPRLMGEFTKQGIKTLADVIAKGSTPLLRAELARACATKPEVIDLLASQADLQRIRGLDKKMAKALAEAGVKSVPQFAFLGVDVITEKLKKRLDPASVPSKTVIEGWVKTAKTLPKAIEFGKDKPGDKMKQWNALSIQGRAERVDECRGRADPLVKEGAALGQKDGEAYLRNLGVPADMLKEYRETHDSITDELKDFQGDWEGGYDKEHPEISEFTVDGKRVATIFRWYCEDGSEGMGQELFYDHNAKKFAGTLMTCSANGEHEWR